VQYCYFCDLATSLINVIKIKLKMLFTEKINKYLGYETESSIEKAIKDIDEFCKKINILAGDIKILNEDWNNYKNDSWLGINTKDLEKRKKNICDKIKLICYKLEPYQENFNGFYIISKPKPKIFISFNKNDTTNVDFLESNFGNQFVEIIRFDKHFNGSKDIEDSIDDSISESKITLLVVTENSLSSSWVWEEVYLSLRTERALKRKLFVCSFDNSIFDSDKINQIALEIDAKSKLLEKEIIKRRKKITTDSFDIDEEKLRVALHQTIFIKVINKLKQKPVYLLFGEKLALEMQRLIKDIKEVI